MLVKKGGRRGESVWGSSGSPEPSTESNWFFILSQTMTSVRMEACLLASPTQDRSPFPEEGTAPQSPTQFTPSPGEIPAGNEAPPPPHEKIQRFDAIRSPAVPAKHQGQERKTLAAPSPTFQRPILGNMLLKLGEIKHTGGRPRCVRLPPPPAGALMGRQLSSLLPRP